MVREYDLRFEQLYEQYEDLLRRVCKRYDKKMPRDEIWQIAMIGLFYADCTYQRGLDYETHVIVCVEQALRAALEKQKAGPYCISLNHVAGNMFEGGELLTLLRAPMRDRELKIMFDELCRELSTRARVVIYDIRGKSGLEDIAEDRDLSEEELGRILRHIRRKFEQRYGFDCTDC